MQHLRFQFGIQVLVQPGTTLFLDPWGNISENAPQPDDDEHDDEADGALAEKEAPRTPMAPAESEAEASEAVKVAAEVAGTPTAEAQDAETPKAEASEDSKVEAEAAETPKGEAEVEAAAAEASNGEAEAAATEASKGKAEAEEGASETKEKDAMTFDLDQLEAAGAEEPKVPKKDGDGDDGLSSIAGFEDRFEDVMRSTSISFEISIPFLWPKEAIASHGAYKFIYKC